MLGRGSNQVAEPTAAVPKRALVMAATLRERIVRGEIAADEGLPVEAALMKQFNASRFIVREALRVLEVEGLLEIRRGPGGGPRVRHPPIAVAAQAVGVQFQLRDVPIRQVWDVRTDLVLRAVETLAAGPAADAVALLEVLVTRLAAAESDAVGFPPAWVTFTEEMVRLAGNDARYVLVRALHEITESQMLAATRRAGTDEANVFRSLVAASCATVVAQIAEGDGAAAVEEFRRQSDAKADGMDLLLGDAVVVDLFAGSPQAVVL
jgi:DNA-binding FadR family transcriptional regulator